MEYIEDLPTFLNECGFIENPEIDEIRKDVYNAFRKLFENTSNHIFIFCADGVCNRNKVDCVKQVFLKNDERMENRILPNVTFWGETRLDRRGHAMNPKTRNLSVYYDLWNDDDECGYGHDRLDVTPREIYEILLEVRKRGFKF